MNFAFRFGSTAVLARLLTPQDYGIVAMTVVITGFALLIGDGGLTWATVQKMDIKREQVSNLFWVNAVIGCFITLSLVLLSPVVAIFYGEPKVEGVTCGLALTFFLSGLTVQHQALLKRQMRFNAIAIIDIGSTVSSIATAIIMATLGYRYWALVGMAFGYHFIKMLAVWTAVPWIPGLPRRGFGIRPLLNFGTNIMGFNMFNYFSRNMDNLLIGRYWGPAYLGIYEKAYNLLLFPISQINAPLTTVVVPALSRLNSEPEKFKRYFLTVFQVVASFITPIIFSITIFADQVVEFWLGAGWFDCADIFRFISIAALLGAISSPIGWLLISTGKTRRYRNLGVLNAVIIVFGFLLGLKYGVEGVALGYSVAMCPATTLSWVYGLKGTNIKVYEVVRIFLWPAFASAFASIASFIFLSFLNKITTSIIATSFGGLSFFIVYAFTLLVVFRKYNFFVDLLRVYSEKGTIKF